MELPTSFFLDLAWDPDAWPVERMADYHRNWAAQQFGREHAEAIGRHLTDTARLLARRKPELLDAETWSLEHFDEADRVLGEYDALESAARATGRAIGSPHQDAYYQLVLHPIEAAANLNRLYVTVARNRLHAAQRRSDTNALAGAAEALFANDAVIAERYESRAGGKWVHMMDQTHIGYTGWQQPPTDVMPAVERIRAPATAEMGVAIEGGTATSTRAAPVALVLQFERYGQGGRTIDVFNRGSTPFTVTARSRASWLRVFVRDAQVGATVPVEISIDWKRAPPGRLETELDLRGSEGSRLMVRVVAQNRDVPGQGFIEADGHVTMEAVHFARAKPANGIRWMVIPELGRTGSSVTPIPQKPASFEAGAGPSLEYDFHLFGAGDVTVELVASPSLDVIGGRGLRYAIALDEQPPQVVDLLAGETEKSWGRSVIEAARIGRSRHSVGTPGRHVLRLWMVDPGVVAQRLSVITRPLPQTALGPPESERR
jgi:hypothetical protein